MGHYPPSLVQLIERLGRLPGLGRKSATRLALYLLRQPEEDVRALAESMLDMKAKISFCSMCHNFTDEDPCALCRDEGRARGELCVVESPGDLTALETAGVFKGRYHILGGALSPLSGVGPEDLRVNELFARIQPEGVTEVLLATGASPEGEATANYLADELRSRGVRVTRIAVGVPLGADLEFVDEATLRRALTTKREL
jgi:recombination protein RecR